MKKYFNDPRPITIRYQANCAECNARLKKGSQAYYWPSNGKIYCISCGESEYRQFLSAAADEAISRGLDRHNWCLSVSEIKPGELDALISPQDLGAYCDQNLFIFLFNPNELWYIYKLGFRSRYHQ